MREVAVTEGDKVEAQARLGFSVNGYGVADLAARVAAVADAEVDRLVDAYADAYDVAPALRSGGDRHASSGRRPGSRPGCGRSSTTAASAPSPTRSRTSARSQQLPGIGVQRLMADGYGFGAEGDWKAAALVRILKVMGEGLPGGTSFMEDYTYHLGRSGPRGPRRAHARGLPVDRRRPGRRARSTRCRSAAARIRSGSSSTPPPGPAVVVGLADLGDRFRLIANEVDVVEPDAPLPRLPVARAVWRPRPDLATAAEAWLTAGGPAPHGPHDRARGSRPSPTSPRSPASSW